jgi:hypothetical protein
VVSEITFPSPLDSGKTVLKKPSRKMLLQRTWPAA